MKTSRKKSDAYRFNGDPSHDPHSIRPVTIADLESRIEKYAAKHADPSDPDDKKWIQSWIHRYEIELKKKRRSLAQKQKSYAPRFPQAPEPTDHAGQTQSSLDHPSASDAPRQ